MKRVLTFLVLFSIFILVSIPEIYDFYLYNSSCSNCSIKYVAHFYLRTGKHVERGLVEKTVLLPNNTILDFILPENYYVEVVVLYNGTTCSSPQGFRVNSSPSYSSCMQPVLVRVNGKEYYVNATLLLADRFNGRVLVHAVIDPSNIGGFPGYIDISASRVSCYNCFSLYTKYYIVMLALKALIIGLLGLGLYIAKRAWRVEK